MAHLVMTQQATDYPKLFALKNLLSVFYKYPMGTLSKDLLAELLLTFKGTQNLCYFVDYHLNVIILLF